MLHRKPAPPPRGVIRKSETTNSLDTYMVRIGGIPLLTKEDEGTLGQAILIGMNVETIRESLPKEASGTLVVYGLLERIGINFSEGLRVAQRLGIPSGATFKDLYECEEYRVAINYEPSLRELFEESITEGEMHAILQFSLDVCTLPPETIPLVGEADSEKALQELLHDDDTAQLLHSLEQKFQWHFLHLQHEKDKAREKFIESNLRLSVSIAKKYLRSGKHLKLDDLIQEGNRGLLASLRNFDWRKGFKFSTYATWWVRQAITRATAEHSNLSMRVPVHVKEKYDQIVRIRERYRREHSGREISDSELRKETGLTKERLEEIEGAMQRPIFLHQQLNSENNAEFGEFIPDEAPSPDEQALEIIRAEAVDELLSHLPNREREVLEKRFGFNGGSIQTLEEIGKEFGVTRERIRQLESRALRTLRGIVLQRSDLHNISEGENSILNLIQMINGT